MAQGSSPRDNTSGWASPTEAYRQQFHQDSAPPRPMTAGPEGSTQRRRSSSRSGTPAVLPLDSQDSRQWRDHSRSNANYLAATPPPPYDAIRPTSAHGHRRSHSRSRSQQVVDPNPPPVPVLSPRSSGSPQASNLRPYVTQEFLDSLPKRPPPPPLELPPLNPKPPYFPPDQVYPVVAPPWYREPGQPSPPPAAQKPFLKRMFGGFGGGKSARPSTPGPLPANPGESSGSRLPRGSKPRSRTKSF
ncbi:hypothetical protein DL96DRAFT_555525 [Flagelloscypha sp. PMI_526]|nr:hypothetical protein DL96DRAFT_555525 [Flagelloscypha sp. PMI_526]